MMSSIDQHVEAHRIGKEQDYDEYMEDFGKLDVGTAMDMAYHKSYETFRCLEVIRNKICDDGAVLESAGEMKSKVADLGKERDALLKEVSDLRTKNAALAAQQVDVNAKVTEFVKPKVAADQRIIELEKLIKSSVDSKVLIEGRLKEQHKVVESLRLEVERGNLHNKDLQVAVKNLEDSSAVSRDLGLSATRRYASVVEAFGGVSRDLPESGVSDIMNWFATSFLSLKDFVGKAGDFAGLSGVMTLLSLVEKKGCKPLEDFRLKGFTFPSLSELGEISHNVQIASYRFMRDFWSVHGRAHSRQLAEARRLQALRGKALQDGNARASEGNAASSVQAEAVLALEGTRPLVSQAEAAAKASTVE